MYSERSLLSVSFRCFPCFCHGSACSAARSSRSDNKGDEATVIKRPRNSEHSLDCHPSPHDDEPDPPAESVIYRNRAWGNQPRSTIESHVQVMDAGGECNRKCPSIATQQHQWL